ncbi:Protein phosphatase Slingshot-like 1 [Acipenser ruthenus]|uniref:Protein phosphatase Slingshot-like 1 n=1 Tax=Acipenser ruthenus TaxID=7906 RepID=A0A444UTP9_ACIRT|nr:Protein phosphatase Slingshot-like 1 [Acipenser ruthenus]
MHLVVESSQDAVLKMLPCFVENAVLTQNEICRILSESFFMVKGAALFLQQGSSPQSQKKLLTFVLAENRMLNHTLASRAASCLSVLSTIGKRQGALGLPTHYRRGRAWLGSTYK